MGGSDFAKPLGNKRGPGSLELEQGRGEGTSVGEGKRESSDPRESWGWGGGGVGLDFPGHKISKQLKSINMFIFRLARSLNAWVPPPSLSISFSS